MFVTVAICTWNRAKLLDQTLKQMRDLQIPEGVEWELIVVNNNCTDDTDEVIQRHEPALPIRRLFEPKPGQCNARNCAVEAARGEIIVWTDDDVIVGPEWLGEYCKAKSEYPDAAFWGGPIVPWFEGEPPQWLQRSWPAVSGAYAVRMLGEDSFEIKKEDDLPYGANFAVSADLQKENLYDARIGLRPGVALRGDEVEMLSRLLKQGVHGRWVPNANVRHFVPKARQRVKYLREYFFGIGQTKSIISESGQVKMMFGRPRWLWRRALEAELLFQVTRLTSSSDVWINHLRIASSSWGYLWGAPT